MPDPIETKPEQKEPAQKVEQKEYITREEVATLIQQAKEQGRSEEKDKLYQEISKRDEALKKFESEADDYRTTFSKMKDIFMPPDKKDDPNLKPETIFSELQRQRQETEDLRKKSDENYKLVESLTQNLYKERIERLKLQKITALKNTGRNLIEEMVTGTNEEEIDASIAKAVDTYTKYTKGIAIEKDKTAEELEKQKAMTTAVIASGSPELHQAPTDELNAVQKKVDQYVRAIYEGKMTADQIPEDEWSSIGPKIKDGLYKAARKQAEQTAENSQVITDYPYKRFES